MRIQKQLGPTDCWRTCVAMILDKDAADVPHFYEDQSIDAALGAGEDAKAWLRNCGYTMFSLLLPAELNFNDAKNMAVTIFANYPFIMSGTSLNGMNHAVVVGATGLVIDPLIGAFNDKPFKHACRFGLDGWIIEVIVPVLN